MESYQFRQREYKSIPALANAMGVNWDEGRAFLLNGGFRDQIKDTDKSLASVSMGAERKYRDDPRKANLIFLQWLVKMPGVSNLYWMGKNYGNLDHICSLLKDPVDDKAGKLLQLMVQEQILSDFVQNSGRPDQVVSNVRFLERSFNKTDTKFNRSNIFVLLYWILTEQKVFTYDGKQFRTVQELAAHLQTYADQSRSSLSSKVEGLFQNDANLNPVFEGWLLNLGYQRELSSWRDRYQLGNQEESRDDEFVLLEDVEVKKEAGIQSNRDFSKTAAGFDQEFTKIMQQYPDVLSDVLRFQGLLKDFFPEKDLLIFLMTTCYKMDIVKAIKDASELNDLFTARFIRRMENDFGVKEDFAKWAVSVWCVVYGERILNKKNRVTLYEVL